MKFLVNGLIGVAAVQILVVWVVVDEKLHGGEIQKALPAVWVWIAISVLGGSLIGLSRSKDRPSTGGCLHGFVFLLVVIPFSLLLGFVREVVGTNSEPEGFWIKAGHVLVHAAFFAAAAALISSPRRKPAA